MCVAGAIRAMGGEWCAEVRGGTRNGSLWGGGRRSAGSHHVYDCVCKCATTRYLFPLASSRLPEMRPPSYHQGWAFCQGGGGGSLAASSSSYLTSSPQLSMPGACLRALCVPVVPTCSYAHLSHIAAFVHGPKRSLLARGWARGALTGGGRCMLMAREAGRWHRSLNASR